MLYNSGPIGFNDVDNRLTQLLILISSAAECGFNQFLDPDQTTEVNHGEGVIIKEVDGSSDWLYTQVLCINGVGGENVVAYIWRDAHSGQLFHSKRGWSDIGNPRVSEVEFNGPPSPDTRNTLTITPSDDPDKEFDLSLRAN